MKITFVGGGSFMTLPIARAALATSALTDGQICLYDPNSTRAEAMAGMIMKTPEFADSGCVVRWDVGLDEALDGADVVRVGFPCGSEATWRAGEQVCHTYGFCGSDQLSPTGAFLALKGGPIVLDIARRMERLAPEGILAIFANPVAVYSSMVNNHTKIRAFGICGGYQNHMWDLTRILGRDEACHDYDVEVAGVNHLSFILRGTLHGEDIYQVIGSRLTSDWQIPEISGNEVFRKNVEHAVTTLVKVFRDFGVLIFSTEGDGMGHIYDAWQPHDGPKTAAEVDMAAIRAGADARRTEQAKADKEFAAILQRDLDAEFWDTEWKRDRTFARTDHDVLNKIIRAKAGLGAQKIVTSLPNNGAVAGFTDRTVLEYSQVFDGKRAVPSSDNLAVPSPFQGLISSLATHQTLLADAIVSQNPRDLYHALYAYPMKQGSESSRAMYRALLEINKGEIAEGFWGLDEYLG